MLAKAVHDIRGLLLRWLQGIAILDQLNADEQSGSSDVTDHRVFGKAVFPATASLEMALAAAHDVIGQGSYTLEQLSIAEPLLLRADGEDILQTVFTPDGAEAGSFQLFSRTAAEEGATEHWRLHATGHPVAPTLLDAVRHASAA